MSTIWKELPTVDRGMYFETLFDPHQTHALYGVTPEKIDYWKDYLKSFGAKKFRVVKNGYYPIICFEWVRDEIAEGQKLTNSIMNEEENYRAKILLDSTEYGKFYKSHYSSEFMDRAAYYIVSNFISIKILNMKKIEEIMSESSFQDKDLFRIYCIIEKSLRHKEEFLFADIDWDRAIQLAQQMNQAISSDEKRIARKNAAEKLGFFRIAKFFN